MVGPEAVRLTWFFPLRLVTKQLPKAVRLVPLSVCVHGGRGPAPEPHMIPLSAKSSPRACSNNILSRLGQL